VTSQSAKILGAGDGSDRGADEGDSPLELGAGYKPPGAGENVTSVVFRSQRFPSVCACTVVGQSRYVIQPPTSVVRTKLHVESATQ